MNSIETASEYLALSDEIFANGHAVNIFTITFICKCNTSLPIDSISRVFKEPDVFVKQPSDNIHFHNQMTLTFRDISRKSIKIFANGTLQITGLSSYLECDDVCQMVIHWLIKYAPYIMEIYLVDRYVAMMNAKVSTYSRLLLVDICRALRLLPDVICLYNPETYPGLNVKILDTKVSVLIFRTGNIVIAGARSIDDIRHVYTLIHKIIGSNSTQPIVEKKDQVKLYCGYTVKSLMSCSFRD
jgi:TATA-box binding protein (TBP) (component of TFIID and TFIIIB)